MSKALEDVIEELFEMAADLLKQGDEENAVELAGLIGKLMEALK